MGLPEPQEPLSTSFPASRAQSTRPSASRALKWVGCLTLLALTSLAFDSSNGVSLADALASTWSNPFIPGSSCQPPQPNLFAFHPPRPSNELIIKASKSLDKYLSNRASKSDIDSISVAVVTPGGSLFEAGYGVLKANETGTENARPVDRDSIYRIASISKMFTVLETLILRERGVLNWDDSVEKYLPDFSPPSYGWGNYLDGEIDIGERPRITLRQLASHLAGIGRDYPPQDIGEWPITTAAIVEPPVDFPEHSYEDIIKAVSQYPLVNVPYEYPIYSNTGIDFLGLSNIAANKLASLDPSNEPQTHKELIQRDVFAPLGMNSSFFRVPPADSPLVQHIAVPSTDAGWADVSLGDMDDAAGGQYSSLGDLATLMRTLLSPTAKGGVIPARTVREWLRPLYVWGASQQQVGAPWEIESLGSRRAYAKGGNLPGYHSEFALVPELSVGLVVLVTGTYADTNTILKEAAARFLPAMRALHLQQVTRQYVGTWTSGNDIAEVVLDKAGVLVLKKLIVRGVDVLALVQSESVDVRHKKGVPVALWSTGTPGEFRLAFGRPALNDVKDIGCMPYWVSIDPGVNSRGAPIDVLYWKNGILTYPSSGVSFNRH